MPPALHLHRSASLLRLAARAVALTALVAALGATAAPAQSQRPEARAGRLDLTGWSLSERGPVELRGEWQVYWDSLDPESDGKPAQLTELPAVWPRAQGRPWATGYATYRLEVAMDRVPEIVALRVDGVSTAYELWADGQKLGGVGEIGTSKDASTPDSAERIYFLSPAAAAGGPGSLELELRVSNFDFRSGGPHRAIELGLVDQLAISRDVRLSRTLFFFGCFLILAFYHLLVFTLRRNLRAALYFGLLCLMSSGHLLVVDNDIFRFLLPELGWTVGLKLEYCFFILIGGFFWLHLSTQFPREMPQKQARVVATISFALALSVLLTPTTFSSAITLRAAQFFLLASFPYLVARIGLAALAGRRGALLFLVGAVLFMGTGIIDSLSSISPTLLDRIPRLAPVGFLVFVLLQAVLLARAVASTFERVEHLSRRLLSLDRLKDEFLANTSQELRTPLQGIIGIADGLGRGAQGELPGSVRDQLGMIVDSGTRLSRLVDDVLDFSRMRNSDLELERSLCSLHASVDVVCTLLQPAAAEKGISLRNHVTTDLPGVDADAARLHQILHNLIGNAIRSTEEGGVSVSAEHDGKHAVLTVSDTGIGIAPDALDRVFEPFEQEPALGTRQHSTGLGLAITRQLVELHGGSISCTSGDGDGATFRFSLPLHSAEQGSGEGQPSEPVLVEHPVTPQSVPRVLVTEPPPGATGKLPGTVLIVDDDPVHRTVLINYLRSENYRVLAASNGEEALELMPERPDLVVLDVMMPRISGIELCARLRERCPANELPVIFLTAKTRPSDVVVGLRVGANDYLPKPVHRDELLARIATHMKVKRLTDERLDLEQAAFVDGLTGLANRHRFDTAVTEGYGADFRELSVLYIDLDRFKEINDDYGHEAGDRVLQVTAQRLRNSVRSIDLLARLGGDEFVIVLRAGAGIAGKMATRLSALLSDPVDFDGVEIAVGASIGTATRPADGSDISELLRAADEEMYRTKRRQPATHHADGAA